jgi:hypothetical protein
MSSVEGVGMKPLQLLTKLGTTWDHKIGLTGLGSRERKLSRLPVADTDALEKSSTTIPDPLLRTCDWSRSWPSQA